MEEIRDFQGDVWEVFIQTKPGQSFKHAGSLHAYDKEMAIKNARDLYTRRNEGTALWVVPSKEIAAVDINASAAFFEPNNDKVYRHPTFYNIPADVKQI